MRAYTLTHLSDAVLLRDLTALVAQDRATTAVLLAHLAEVDARRLYAPAGHASMFAYCVDGLHLSEGAAYRRIQAARVARQFPAFFGALADGQVHLTAVLLLGPHLTAENAGELLAAVTHRRKSEIEAWLARRFPTTKAPAPSVVRVLPAIVGPSNPQLAPAQVEIGKALEIGELAPARVEATSSGDATLPAERYRVHLTLDKRAHDKLRRAQALLSHSVPSGDIAQVFERALDVLIDQLERRKFAAKARTRQQPQVRQTRPQARPGQRPSTRRRYVPAQVKRAVWERDQGRCTYLGENGHRCGARRLLEFDHINPVARGGRASIDGMRLRCRAHNQYEAECAFGAEFMHDKRTAGSRAATGAGAQASAAALETGTRAAPQGQPR